MEVIDQDALLARVDWCVGLAASPIYRRYRQYVHVDDLRQECWLWVLEHKRRAVELLDRSEAYLIRRLRTVAERYARKQKAARCGYSPDDEAYYSISRIAELLPDALDPEATPPTGQASEIRGSSEQHGEWETSIADIRGAVAKLPVSDQWAVRMWAGYGAVDIPPDIMTIVRAIQKLLGGARPNDGGNR